MTIPDDAKMAIHNDIINGIFKPEKHRLKILMDRIQDKHAELNGSRAFILDGKPVFNGDAEAARNKYKKNLSSEFVDEARFIVKAQTKLNIDQQKITNLLSMVSTRCTTYADYRDALPDMVVELIKDTQIKGIPRTREAGYIFSSNPIQLKQFEILLSHIEHYLINQMVF